MDIGCLFAPTTRAPDHIAEAERLGAADRASRIEEYILGLRALMAGEEIDWEGTRIALTFPGQSGLAPVTDVPVLAAAHGPKGFATSPRVVDAAGPGAALGLHLGEFGPLAGADEVRGYQTWLAPVPEERRHIGTHREHLIGVTPEERPCITPKVIEAATATGTPEQIRERLKHLEQSGATTVAHQPAGPDIERELRAFATTAGL
ncbi:LLM class flavin-dependent oxidoreductase [Streptomyces spongiae]|uniref:LLM class flavin-dependent oxidoreductase n=2 Tax=Streptomyces spongiae TaxID=565072 RepID=A0A5N8XTQ9_9ACTN|nr:LLM class flavin-dependent oxidoreductase [Streptomyces spongiae]